MNLTLKKWKYDMIQLESKLAECNFFQTIVYSEMNVVKNPNNFQLKDSLIIKCCYDIVFCI